MKLHTTRPAGKHAAGRGRAAALAHKGQRRNDVATILAYHRFCRLHPAYRHLMSNQLRIFDWVDERRIEMLAEGRPHWVPSERDFWLAMRDCWDDLVKR